MVQIPGDDLDDSQHQQTPSSKLRADQMKPPGLSTGHDRLRNYLVRRGGAPNKRTETLRSSTNRPDLSMKREVAMVTMDGSMLQLPPASARAQSRTTADGDSNRMRMLLPTQTMRHVMNKSPSLAKHGAVRPNKTFGGQKSSPATPFQVRVGYEYSLTTVCRRILMAWLSASMPGMPLLCHWFP